MFRSATRAYNSCTSSSELDAQHVTPHQTTIKKKETTPASHVPAWILCHVLRNESAKGAAKKQRFPTFSTASHERADHWDFSGTAGAAGRHQMVKNRKANCCTLLKRITKLKCVNSEVKSVKHLPHNGGSLKWVHGTMSESPWKSH